MEVENWGEAYSKAGSVGQWVEVLKRNRFQKALPPYPWDVVWMLSWFTFLRRATEHGKCLGRNFAFDSLSAANFDLGRENNLLGKFKLKPWATGEAMWNHWHLGPCLGSSTRWPSCAALQRVAKGSICWGSIMTILNFHGREHLFSSLILLFCCCWKYLVHLWHILYFIQ